MELSPRLRWGAASERVHAEAVDKTRTIATDESHRGLQPSSGGAENIDTTGGQPLRASAARTRCRVNASGVFIERLSWSVYTGCTSESDTRIDTQVTGRPRIQQRSSTMKIARFLVALVMFSGIAHAQDVPPARVDGQPLLRDSRVQAIFSGDRLAAEVARIQKQDGATAKREPLLTTEKLSRPTVIAGLLLLVSGAVVTATSSE